MGHRLPRSTLMRMLWNTSTKDIIVVMPCFGKEVLDFPQALIIMMTKGQLEELPPLATSTLLKIQFILLYVMLAQKHT